MNYSSDSIHKDHDLLLENFGGVGEISDVAETEDRYDLLPWYDGVHTTRALHVLSDNLGASLAEAQGEKRPNVDDRLLQHISLKHHIVLSLLLVRLLSLATAPPPPFLSLALQVLQFLHRYLFIFFFLRCSQGILGNARDLLDHLLDGIDHELIAIGREDQRAEDKHHAHEDRVRY
jgi:hypothetical protein